MTCGSLWDASPRPAARQARKSLNKYAPGWQSGLRTPRERASQKGHFA